MGKSNYMNRMRQYKKGSFVKKYQPGGMLMYGDPKLGNQTFANMVYEESDPAKQEMLAQQMQQTVNDTSGIEQAEQQGMRVQNTASGIESGIGQGLTTGIAQLAKSGATGKLATAASKASAYNPYAIGANILGSGISAMSNDNDATTLNFGEGFGTALSNAGTGASIGSMILPGVGTLVGAGLGAAYGLGRGIYQRNRARRNIGSAEQERENKIGMLGARTRREGVLSREYSGYDFGRTLAKHGGVRLPGGTMNPIPGSDAVEFKGKSHKQGGILLDEQTEVEGGETMDKVTMKDEGPSDYFFSKYLKLGGRSYAQRHKEILKKGGTQQDIDALAKSQEMAAGRNPGVVEMERGGVRKYQYAGPYFYTPMNPMLPNYKMTVGVPELQLPGSGNQVDFLAGIRNRNETNTQTTQTAGLDPTGLDPRMYGPFAPVDNTYVDVNTKLPPMGPMGPNLEEPLGVNTPIIRTPVRTEESKEATVVPTNTSEGTTAGTTAGTGTGTATETDTREEETPITSIKPKPLPNILDDATPVKPEIVEQIKQLEAKEKTQGLTDDERKALKKLYRDVPLGAYAAGAAQMIPAAYAFLRKEKAQKLMGPAGRIGSPKLDRVDFNKERSQNASDARALNKSIETSGSGPAGIIAKMAAFKRKQDGDMQIATAETRANAGIQAQEAQMKQQADSTNVQNALAIDNVNTQMMENQRVANENRKYMAIDKFADSYSGLMGDVMSYKANERMARAIGSMGIYEREKLFNSLLGKVNPRTGRPYTKDDIAELYNISLEDNNLLQEAESAKTKSEK